MSNKTRFALMVSSMAMLILCLSGSFELLMAQSPPPPALPGMPDQAPLGGLGLLAAAGGAYAWKKLRNKEN
ncbi:MAG: hypothetical protein LAT57_10360 [Balneolales bacterium]|nr:hypothetical protein [Balneolales bacterium]